MTVEREEKKQSEELSKAIDALHRGQKYHGDRETEELAEIAGLIQGSGAVAPVSARLLEATVDRLAVELKTKNQKRRRFRLLTGFAGTAAAVWLVVLLQTNLFMGTQPGKSPSAPDNKDLARIVQIQREEPVEVKPKQPEATPKQTVPAPEAPQALAGRSVTADKAAAPEIQSGAVREERRPEEKKIAAADAPAKEKPSKKVLVLAGRTATDKKVNAATGEIRQTYTTEQGEVALIQSGKAAEGETGTARQTAAPLKANVSARKAGAMNRVTVVVDGIEATLEGEQTEEELNKLAGTLTGQ